MNMRWDSRVHCDVEITVPLTIGTLSVADLEVTVTVYRDGDQIEIDDSSFDVDGWRGNIRSSHSVKRTSQALEDRVIYDAIMNSLNSRQHDRQFEDELSEREQSAADDYADWLRDERMMAAE